MSFPMNSLRPRSLSCSGAFPKVTDTDSGDDVTSFKLEKLQGRPRAGFEISYSYI